MNGVKRKGSPYKDLVGCVTERVKVDELFDLMREPKEGGTHDVFEEAGQGHHITARLGGCLCCSPNPRRVSKSSKNGRFQTSETCQS